MILQASLLATIIDQAYIHEATRVALLPSLIELLALFTVRALVNGLREWVGAKCALAVKAQLRQALNEKLLHANPAVMQSFKTASVTTTFVEQVEALHDFFAHYLPQLSLVVLLPLVIVAFIFPVNWICGLILLLSAPLIPLFMALIGFGAESVSKQHFKSLQRLSAHFLNILQGLVTLKLFNQSKSQAQTIYQHADSYCQKTMQVLRIAFLSSAVLELFSSAGIAIVAVYLGLVLLGQVHFGAASGLSLQQGLFILLLAPEFYFPLRQLAIHYHSKAQAVAVVSDIQKLLSIPAWQSPHQHYQAINLHQPFTLYIKDLSFAYPEQAPLIQPLTLTIQSGEHIAIVGQSGAGKTTLLKLLLKLLQPTAGSIAVNTIELNQIDLSSWLSQIAWIGQQPRLLPGTIRDNILLGNPYANDEQFQRAVTLAKLDRFLKQWPQGIETKIGEGNIGISGGQAQLILLARAYLKEAPLLILDEPTASLDATTEQLVLTSLKQLSQGRTVITVSHHENTIASADRIFDVTKTGEWIERQPASILESV